MLTSSASYIDALQQLETESLIAPVYYITAGSGHNEGMVITRDRDSCPDTWLLDKQDPGSSWYLLETNYVSVRQSWGYRLDQSFLQDHWKMPLPYDNRREYGIKYMEALGEDNAASTQGLLHVLSLWPLRNNLTTYTTLMTPGEFYMQSFIIYN